LLCAALFSQRVCRKQHGCKCCKIAKIALFSFRFSTFVLTYPLHRVKVENICKGLIFSKVLCSRFHGCKVKDCALIGMGATILNDAVIGEGAIVAAGSLVLKGTQVGDGELWGGVPAKFIKKVDPEQSKELNQGIASHYLMYAEWYKE
jgi:hypothetical protein